MTTKRINRLVNTFLATGPKDLSINAFDRFLNAQGESYKFEDLPQSFLKPFIHNGYYVPSGNSIYPIKEYLEQGQFVIELTGPERHGEYLLAGTRFLWMTDWLTTGKPITLVDSMGNEIPPKPKQAYIKNIKHAYRFTSFYELLELLLEEKEENDPILNIQDPDKDPDELMVHVTCWDLKPFRKTTKTPLSEPLTVTLIDHKNGVFQLDGYLVSRSKTTLTQDELINQYVSTMDDALLRVLTFLGPGYPIPWIFTFATMVNPHDLLRLVPLTFDQYLDRSNKIFLVETGARPQLWYKKAISHEDTELTEPTFNALLISLGILYNETEVEALIRDALFDRQESYSESILDKLLVGNEFHISKALRKELTHSIEELGEEVQPEYNYFADQHRGPVRKELLEAIEDINQFFNLLKEKQYPIQHLPPEAADIFQMKGNLSKALHTLNSSVPDAPEDIHGYEEMSEMIEIILEAFNQSANQVIDIIEKDLEHQKTIAKKVPSQKSKTKTIANPSKLPNPSCWLQLKVTLHQMSPPVWRRILVPDTLTLAELHEVIQISMGWENSHLHQFRLGNSFYVNPLEFDSNDLDFGEEDERAVGLKDLALGEKSRLTYIYDFGDFWNHRILVEKILPLDQPPPLGQRVFCIKGKGPCPPEDTGGIEGFQELLEALNDTNHPDHSEYWDDYGYVLKLSLDLRTINKELEVFGSWP